MKTGDQSAFPKINGETVESLGGMTYRQWLIGMALQGLLAGAEDYSTRAITHQNVKRQYAAMAIESADAILNILEPAPNPLPPPSALSNGTFY